MTELKKCTACEKEKPFSEYGKNKKGKFGLKSKCKPCLKLYDKTYYENNKDEHKQRMKVWWSDPINREKGKKKSLEHYYANYELRRKQIDEWKKNNKDRVNELARKRSKHNRKTNPEWVKIKDTRNKISQALKYYLKENKNKFIDELGCDIEFYVQHITNQFYPEMNWENRNRIWEIDHIEPISKGGSFHYTNTRPLFITTQIAESLGYSNIKGNRNR
jgi:hypothetical protein